MKTITYKCEVCGDVRELETELDDVAYELRTCCNGSMIIVESADEPDGGGRYGYSCTYDPADDKLRMSACSRLPADEYTEIKAAGFSWAPKQGVFYAIWTPARESLMLSWCGEIDDEDTSLVDRAAVRADRFDDYSDKRTNDAERAHKAVAGICEGIPFGQPILVGHHSEKRARKDAEKIERGMERAVKMWDTAEYWKSRAASAIAHAKYKELPAVRARRIKGLSADLRKQTKEQESASLSLKFWRGELALKDGSNPGVTHNRALNWLSMVDQRCGCTLPDGEKYYSGWGALNDGKITVDELQPQRVRSLAAHIAHNQKWIDHINNRLEYERAVLAEGGGLKSDSFDLQVGGKVLTRGSWGLIERINKKAGVICSVSIIGKYSHVVQLEDIREYQPPAEGDSEKVKAATKLAPLCNYPGEGFFHMTTEAYKAKGGWARGKDELPTPSRHRVCTISNRIAKPEGKSEWGSTPVFLTDGKARAPAAIIEAPRELPAVPRELPTRTTRGKRMSIDEWLEMYRADNPLRMFMSEKEARDYCRGRLVPPDADGLYALDPDKSYFMDNVPSYEFAVPDYVRQAMKSRKGERMKSRSEWIKERLSSATPESREKVKRLIIETLENMERKRNIDLTAEKQAVIDS